MDVSSLLIFAGALAVVAGSPGPSVAALVTRVLTNGYRSVLPFVAALWLGEAIWLALAVYGLAAIADTFHVVFVIIKYVGVAYLLYLAWKMWFAPSHVAEDSLPHNQSAGKMFAVGIAITLGNPKVMVFYMALLPTIIDLNSISTLQWGELTLTTIAVLMITDLSWVGLATRARKFLKSRRAVRATNRASATVMAGAAALIAAR